MWARKWSLHVYLSLLHNFRLSSRFTIINDRCTIVANKIEKNDYWRIILTTNSIIYPFLFVCLFVFAVCSFSHILDFEKMPGAVCHKWLFLGFQDKTVRKTFHFTVLQYSFYHPNPDPFRTLFHDKEPTIALKDFWVLTS